MHYMSTQPLVYTRDSLIRHIAVRDLPQTVVALLWHTLTTCLTGADLFGTNYLTHSPGGGSDSEVGIGNMGSAGTEAADADADSSGITSAGGAGVKNTDIVKTTQIICMIILYDL